VEGPQDTVPPCWVIHLNQVGLRQGIGARRIKDTVLEVLRCYRVDLWNRNPYWEFEKIYLLSRIQTSRRLTIPSTVVQT
jgi:hypothetical protein